MGLILCPLVLTICLLVGQGIHHAFMVGILAILMPNGILACGYLNDCYHTSQGVLYD